MNKEFRNYLVKSLEQNIRLRNKGLLDYRDITVEHGVTKTAEGSSRVKIGETEVIAGVKMEIAQPYPDRPDQGSIMVNAEFLTMASPDFESGPPGIKAIELARVVDRGIRECNALDLKELIIKKGEKCWMIVVDICIINHAGNLLDASALAAISALKDARFPKYENDELDYKVKTDRKVPISKTPVAVTVLKLGNSFLVDPDPEEENNLDARLTVTTTEGNVVCSLQKGGESSITIDDISKMLDIAIEKGDFLRSLV